jgi:hypothetical protein
MRSLSWVLLRTVLRFVPLRSIEGAQKSQKVIPFMAETAYGRNRTKRGSFALVSCFVTNRHPSTHNAANGPGAAGDPGTIEPAGSATKSHPYPTRQEPQYLA